MAYQLLGNLRDYLIAQGIVRKPSVAGSDPPLWLDKASLPAPGEGQNATEVDQNLVLGALRSGGIVWPPLHGYHDQPIVEITIRAKYGTQAEAVHYDIRGVLHDKRNFAMGGLIVDQSELFRDLQLIEQSRDYGSVYRVDYSLQIRAT